MSKIKMDKSKVDICKSLSELFPKMECSRLNDEHVGTYYSEGSYSKGDFTGVIVAINHFNKEIKGFQHKEKLCVFEYGVDPKLAEVISCKNMTIKEIKNKCRDIVLEKYQAKETMLQEKANRGFCVEDMAL